MAVEHIMNAFANELGKLDACSEAVRWVGPRDLAAAWAECSRADWVLWYLVRVAPELRPRVVLLICRLWRQRIARYVPAGELRPLRAIEAAEAWARMPSSASATAAQAAAQAAVYAASAVYAAYAASAASATAAWIARTAATATIAAASAYAAGSVATWAAQTAAIDTAGAWAVELQFWADAIRAGFPEPPEVGA